MLKTSSRPTNVCWVVTIIQKTSGILWQYCRDEPTENVNGNIIEFNEDNATK